MQRYFVSYISITVQGANLATEATFWIMESWYKCIEHDDWNGDMQRCESKWQNAQIVCAGHPRGPESFGFL